ncbi:hypothetical protein HNQ36_003036 [Afipia massiliensis]|uniref:Uncharacterized protein n=1 Tax=Afipia massiliensis TaxID=211460 RepID=A0A840MYV5_9BRAD|nr:hypothetical protein [Afipia massiliensis]MBB5053045.1 hypothetical protein [Afipia massiliensis]
MFESNDHPAKLPKLDISAVQELLGLGNSGGVVGVIKDPDVFEMIIIADQIRSILSHAGHALLLLFVVQKAFQKPLHLKRLHRVWTVAVDALIGASALATGRQH